MKILALVASQDSTVEDVKTNGRRQMQALIHKLCILQSVHQATKRFQMAAYTFHD